MTKQTSKQMRHQMQKQKWEDMSTGQRAGAVVAATVQIALAVTAWVDLARRPSEQVKGPKGLWAVIIAINFVGPLSYFIGGRRRAEEFEG